MNIKIDLATELDVYDVVIFLEHKIHWQQGYTKKYNTEYFINCINNGDKLLVARKVDDDNRIIGCMLLKNDGPYASHYKKEDAYYILHFASSDLSVGKKLLDIAVLLADTVGKKYLRGDYNNDIKGLVSYYLRHGARIIGIGSSGEYSYSLLEFDIQNNLSQESRTSNTPIRINE